MLPDDFHQVSHTLRGPYRSPADDGLQIIRAEHKDHQIKRGMCVKRGRQDSRPIDLAIGLTD
jgi:hypothetical protein